MKITKLLTAIALAAALLFSACSKTETENPDNSVNNDPDQTEDLPDYTYDESTNTYTVYKADGLLEWSQAVQEDLSLNCTLAADIDLTDINLTKSDSTGTEWTPIGNYDNPYTGTFDGNGHTITGLTINQSETSYVGLIGCLGSGGKVQNLTLENVSITGSSVVGGVVGFNYEGTVTACNVSGSVSGSVSDGSNTVGGVVGLNYSAVTDCSTSGSVVGATSVGGVVGGNGFNGTVTDCSASCSVSGDSAVGGVVGNNNGTITACTVSGSVSGTSNSIGGVVGSNLYGTVTACYYTSGSVSGTLNVGGVVGWNYGTVTDCTASGNISGSDDRVGGVVGGNYSTSTVTDCSASGSVSGSGNSVGGVVGWNYDGTVTNCSASCSVSGDSAVGGVVGYNYEGTVTDCTASGSVLGSSDSQSVGGVVGWNYGTVNACTASCNVSGTYLVGGVVGWNYEGTMTACYALGSVSSDGKYVGGVLGYNSDGTVTACYHASGSVSGSSYVGGVVGYNNSTSTVTACYWSDYTGNGIGDGSGETTEVDGTSVTWGDAVDGMNAAIETWNSNNPDTQCDWKYELTGDLPTLTKNE